MRANRYRDFLNRSLPARQSGIPTGYLPETGTVSLGYRAGWDEATLAATWDTSVGNLLLLGIQGDLVRIGDQEFAGAGVVRGHLRLLDRTGWGRSFTLALGGYGGTSLDDHLEPRWRGGPFVSADLLLPSVAYTRYSLYAGTDALQGAVTWSPFWRQIEDSVEFRATLRGSLSDGRALDSPDDSSFVGFDVVFHPAQAFWIELGNRNFSSIHGNVVIQY